MRAAPFIAIFSAAWALIGCGDTPNTNINSDSIVSTTLCADSYLLAMPDSYERLAALSWQSRDALSRAPAELRNLPQADNDPERLRKWSRATTVSTAGGTGEIDLAWGEDFDTVWMNFSKLASALKLDDPSSRLKQRLNNLPPHQQPIRLLYLDRSGATAGPGTFVHAVISQIGATNIITQPGWQSPDTETLLALQPDVIITSFMGSDYAGVNDRTFRHDALVDKIANLPHIDIPGKFWPCAGPGLVDAAEFLSKELAAL